MRRFPTTAVILVAAVVTVVGGWLLFARSEHARYVAVNAVRNQRSEFRLTYTVDHARGRIARETWYLQNLNGRSEASYAVTDRHGTTATFDEPIAGYAVTFLFDKLVADGIWDLPSQPFRGSSQAIHIVRIEQVAGPQRGVHQFRFSDAHWLATEAGRQYVIRLDPHKPLPNLVMLRSTSTDDPRYLEIVEDFEHFGPPQFKRTVAAAREKLLKS